MSDEWKSARKRPVKIEYRGPYYVKPTEFHPSQTNDAIETIEGDFTIDDEYLQEHGGFVIIQGVDGEVYPCALDIFRKTYYGHDE